MKRHKITKRRIPVPGAPGIYREKNFYYVTKRKGSKSTEEIPRSTKFPLSTHVDKMKAWQARAEAELLEELPRAAREGTIAADVAEMLTMIEEGQRADFTSLMQHWIESPLGSLHRHELTRRDIRKQRTAWKDGGAAASSVNHRVRALRRFYDLMDGEDTPHPTDRIKKLREPKPLQRGIPMEAVRLILAAIPDRGRAARFGKRGTVSHTKIRLTLMAYTGAPPAQLERLEKGHVDLLGCLSPDGVSMLGGRVFLTPRRKGEGSDGVWVGPLFPEAVAAFVAFGAANLWGKKFSRSSMGKAWKGAIRRITERLTLEAMHSGDRAPLDAWLHVLPPKCHPYDLRHSFGTFAYKVTGDLRAVAELMQHSNLETTKRYTGAAVSERVAAAMAKMHEHLHGAPPPTPTKKRGRGALALVKKTG
jgi:integrase